MSESDRTGTDALADWTEQNGRANSSNAYELIVLAVEEILCNHRLGASTMQTARIIVSQLAHTHGLAPKPKAKS